MVDDENIRGEQDDAPAAVPSPEQPSPVRDTQADDLRQRYDDLNDRYLRLAADFENFRKRAQRDQERIVKHANEQLAFDILEVTDNLDRAVQYDDSSLREGLIQIRQLMTAVLQRHGITPVISLGKMFDPAVHEAIVHMSSDTEEGIIIDEISRGYRLHDKVIRFAKVAVSKGNEKRE